MVKPANFSHFWHQYQDRPYFRFHQPRYQYLIELLARYPLLTEKPNVLDIGPSRLTELLHLYYQTPIHSLGLEPDATSPRGPHYHFDLNLCQKPEDWRQDHGPYDLIVMAEVIEHLYTSPAFVLAYLRTLLKPNGYLLIQTPNAVAIDKRAKLLFGYNPYSLIRLNRHGHYRELTLPELNKYARNSNLLTVEASHHQYFDLRYRKRTYQGTFDHAPPTPKAHFLQIINYLLNYAPPTWRAGITILLKPTQN
ncbi:MAG TPA: class I SAM-dependent methyltransferase [Anaerolineae bacterium]|nr:class I SAM-dependent methyltransferase [Anaerolineae bacterium]